MTDPLSTETKGLIVACAVAAFAWGAWTYFHQPASPNDGMVKPPAALDETGVVVKVCRDGTLVLKKGDHFEIVRPDKLAGWLAASADVCMGRE